MSFALLGLRTAGIAHHRSRVRGEDVSRILGGPEPATHTRPAGRTGRRVADRMRVIAIDGPAGSGKSTVAQRLADRLGLQYLDTGAMYRAVTFAALRRGIDPADVDDVARCWKSLELEVGRHRHGRRGRRQHRDPRSGGHARRQHRGREPGRADGLRRRQREWAADHDGGVIEGRDIGSVVFPEAELKVYLTAEPNVRAGRRAKEVSELDYEQVAADIAKRDALDQGRDDSPLTQVDGALVLDTSNLTVDEIVDQLEARLNPNEATPSPSARPPETTPTPAPTQGAGRPSTEVHGATRGERLLYGFVRGALVGFGRVFFRIDVEGLEHVPPEGPFILSPIHRSNIDFLVVLVCARRRMRYMAKDTLWKPGWGRLFTAARRFSGAPGQRGPGSAANVHQGDRVRRATRHVSRRDPQTGPKLAPMFDGPAYVQSRTGVPIVPVGIGGTETVMPKGAKMIHPHKVVVVIGEPLLAPVTEGSKARRSSVKAQTAKLGEEIQVLFDQPRTRQGHRTSSAASPQAANLGRSGTESVSQ